MLRWYRFILCVKFNIQYLVPTCIVAFHIYFTVTCHWLQEAHLS